MSVHSGNMPVHRIGHIALGVAKHASSNHRIHIS
jgi:hypothetical protein